MRPSKVAPWQTGGATDSNDAIVVSLNWEEIRRFMWSYVGIVRSDKRIERARRRIENVRDEIRQYYWDFKITNDLIELRNLALVANLIIESARRRKESRGLHYTVDYPRRRRPRATPSCSSPTAPAASARATPRPVSHPPASTGVHGIAPARAARTAQVIGIAAPDRWRSRAPAPATRRADRWHRGRNSPGAYPRSVYLTDGHNVARGRRGIPPRRLCFSARVRARARSPIGGRTYGAAVIGSRGTGAWLALALAAAACAGGAAQPGRRPRAAPPAIVDALAGDDPAAAYALLSRDARARVSFEEFRLQWQASAVGAGVAGGAAARGPWPLIPTPASAPRSPSPTARRSAWSATRPAGGSTRRWCRAPTRRGRARRCGCSPRRSAIATSRRSCGR
jgi:hypothetical protein